MKLYKYLIESGKLEMDLYGNGDFPILLNPDNIRDITKFIKRHRIKNIRSMVDKKTGDMWVWNGYDFTHSYTQRLIKQEFGVSYDLLPSTYIWNNHHESNIEDLETQIKISKSIRKQ